MRVTFALLGILLGIGQQAYANWNRVAADWDQYQLNESQRAWFKSIKNRQNVPCCDIADGHPTEMRRRADGGYQIPDPLHPGGEWLDVPTTAMTHPANNPIGIATVWYSLQYPDVVYIRCFVPEAEG
jgi:hypothetical protein